MSFKRRSRPIGQRHAVTGLDIAVGGERKHLAPTACGDDHRLGLELLHLAAADFQRGQALAAPVLDQQISGVILIKTLDARGLSEV